MSQQLFEEMKSNPIFIMSLHAKELFHSNFWAWLFEKNVEYARIFFPEIKSCNKVEREQKNRDVTIWCEEKAYIIENKFKSIPGLEQIKRYQEEVGDKFAKGVITGIIEPEFAQFDSEWKFISYDEICKKIICIANEFETKEFEKELILQYAKVFLKLSNYISDMINASKGQWVTALDFHDLNSIRMDDIVKKLKASEFALFIENKIRREITDTKIGDYDLVIESSFGHKHAIVDVRFVQIKDKNKISVIGIQIEDSGYRRCIQINKNIDDEERTTLFEKYLKLNWFEEYDKSKKIIQGKKTSLRKRYDTYMTSKYTFIYQYWNIVNPSFEDIGNHIIKDIKIAAGLIG